ncbi:hypothetical protein PLICRDRAFT_53201 [Plicaturopsis crispa FD-325 SS-3]|nr:hypothetical protein PLICRDRAFT_53201 [Plicaturopsis crispa FD-325 SS-3]
MQEKGSTSTTISHPPALSIHPRALTLPLPIPVLAAPFPPTPARYAAQHLELALRTVPPAAHVT